MIRTCYFVESRVFSRPGVSVYAKSMFNGLAARHGASYPGLDYRYGHRLRHPLNLTKNAYRIADIFKPGGNWVVSRRVKDLLDGLPHVAFLPVKFEKVFEHPYELDHEPDEEWSEDFDDDDYYDPHDHDPQVEAGMGEWFEVIVANYHQFAQGYAANHKTYKIKREMSSKPLEVVLSAEIFENYAIFWHFGFFVRGDVFRGIKEFLDRNFFRSTRISLSA